MCMSTTIVSECIQWLLCAWRVGWSLESGKMNVMCLNVFRGVVWRGEGYGAVFGSVLS